MPRPIPRRVRRSLVAATALGLAAAAALGPLGAAGPASAADRTPFVLVGTSDVFDSGLVQDVLEPGFEQAYPQYDLQYVSKGTGAAIAFARAGTADAMIVHAASLENQFVGDGYSLERYGRATFWGDYVLLGPQDDPAGVLDGAPRDIATAFEKIAAAGAQGRANFVSRGGTPGTTVQEHAIWALTSPGDGLTTCTVSAKDGGGSSPSTASGACSNPISYPSWYHATGLTQGPNVLNGSVCNYDGGGCYVFTDRGTFAYLQSTGQAQNLQIVTRDNAPDARGGQPLLVNSFHAYAVNPAKFADTPNVSLNTPAARAFLDWVTSSDVQTRIGGYLADRGAPFLPSAAPRITGAPTHKIVDRGASVGLRGTLANVVPGTPVLAGVKVRIYAVKPDEIPARPRAVGTATTNRLGQWSFAVRPSATTFYLAGTLRLNQIVDERLDPPFGDILVGGSKRLGTVKVRR